ncbi:hypothetical protein [Mucilaginibacter gynuensis]
MACIRSWISAIRRFGGMVIITKVLTIALKGKAKDPGTQIENKTITVEGEVIDYKGKPEIIVTDPAKIKF